MQSRWARQYLPFLPTNNQHNSHCSLTPVSPFPCWGCLCLGEWRMQLKRSKKDPGKGSSIVNWRSLPLHLFVPCCCNKSKKDFPRGRGNFHCTTHIHTFIFLPIKTSRPSPHHPPLTIDSLPLFSESQLRGKKKKISGEKGEKTRGCSPCFQVQALSCSPFSHPWLRGGPRPPASCFWCCS